MRDLIERIEAATGPDREIDCLIRQAVYAPSDTIVEQSPINGAWCIYHGVDRSGRPRLWEGPGRHKLYTASLDDAMGLVPEGCDRADHVWPDSEGRFCTYLWAQRRRHQVVARARAATAPLALCAAALRAREQEGD